MDFVRWVKENWYRNVVMIRPEVSFDKILKNCGKPIKSKLKSKDLHQWQCGKRSESLKQLMIDSESTHKNQKHRFADKDIHMLHDDFGIIASPQCCDYLKKRPFEYYAKKNGMKGNMQGVRVAEGGARETAAKTRISHGGKLCTWVKHGIIQKAPIIDWTDEDVEEFIQEYHVPLSEAYTKYGFKRTGCMACPYSRSIEHDLEYLYFHEPNRYKASMHWLKDVYIAQGVDLPFDEEYQKGRENVWDNAYHRMRREMLEKYRPNSKTLRGYYAKDPKEKERLCGEQDR